MKKVLSLITAFTLLMVGNAQVEIPQPSPFGKFEQKIGLTDVTVEYSRPAKKERVIFGDLVPYGKMWRTGANKNTVISFSDDVVVDGQKLKAGKYALFTTPGKDQWEVIFYSETENWGLPQKWDDSKVAAKTTVKVHQMPMVMETFTLLIDDLTNNSGTLGILWDKVYVGVKLEVPTDEKVMGTIGKTMQNDPKWEDYYAAATYYFNADKDIKQAKEWIDKAMGMNPKPMFYQLRQQSLIYAKAGDKKGAIDLAKQSLDASQKAGNEDYVKMNQESLKEWGSK